MKKITEFLSRHGYAVMLAGMAIVISAGAILVNSRQTGGVTEPFVWPVAILGIFVYAAGRIGVTFRKKQGPGHSGESNEKNLNR